MNIHKFADVHPDAQLADDVTVGAFTVIGPRVTIGKGTQVMNNVTVDGYTAIGENNTIFPSAVVGAIPQDLKYYGEESRLEIGDNNSIRECVTINIGTEGGGWVTRIGNQNLLMACSHIGHDCQIGDRTIVANCGLLAGHCVVEDDAKIMGLVGVQQFTTIGQHAYVGGLGRVVQDVPPFMMVAGDPTRVIRPNVIGLQRAGFSEERVDALREAHKLLFGPGVVNRSQVAAELEQQDDLTEDVHYLLDFLKRQQQGKAGRAREAERTN